MIIPMLADLNPVLLDINYELRHILAQITVEGGVLLKTFMLACAFLEFVEKRANDRSFE